MHPHLWRPGTLAWILEELWFQACNAQLCEVRALGNPGEVAAAAGASEECTGRTVAAALAQWNGASSNNNILQLESAVPLLPVPLL